MDYSLLFSANLLWVLHARVKWKYLLYLTVSFWRKPLVQTHVHIYAHTSAHTIIGSATFQASLALILTKQESAFFVSAQLPHLTHSRHSVLLFRVVSNFISYLAQEPIPWAYWCREITTTQSSPGFSLPSDKSKFYLVHPPCLPSRTNCQGLEEGEKWRGCLNIWNKAEIGNHNHMTLVFWEGNWIKLSVSKVNYLNYVVLRFFFPTWFRNIILETL